MSDTKSEESTPAAPSASPKRRGKLLRYLALASGALLAFVVFAYFLVTSSFFLKAVVLPQAGKAIGADLQAGSVSLSPFSGVVISQIRIKTIGDEFLLEAERLKASYNLMDIIGGKITVLEVSFDAPKIQIIQNPDGTSNIDPVIAALTAPKPPKPKSAPPQLNIKNVSLNNASVRVTKHLKGDKSEIYEVSGLQLSLDQLVTGQPSKLKLGAQVKLDVPPAAGSSNAANSHLEAKLSGDLDFALAPDFMPQSLSLQTSLNIAQATGAWADVNGLAAQIRGNVTLPEIRELAVSFSREGQSLGEIRAAGRYELAKTEGALDIAILAIDRHVLNLVGAAKGIDFGSTTINATNHVELAQAGKLVKVAGHIDIAKLSVKQEGSTTPPMDVQLAYRTAVDLADLNATVEKFTLSGTQRNQQMLRANLSQPLHVAWGKNANGVGESVLDLAVTGLNLADWRPFAGQYAPDGLVNLNLNLNVRDAGKNVTFDLASQIDGLTVLFQTNRIEQAGVTLKAKGKMDEFTRIKLADYRVELTRSRQPVLSLAGSAQYDLKSGEAELPVEARIALAKVLELVPQPNLSVQDGALTFKGRVTQKGKVQAVNGKLNLETFTGRFAAYELKQFTTALDLDLELHDSAEAVIRKLNGSLRSGTDAAGAFELNGNYSLKKSTGDLQLKVTDMNQHAIRPFLAPVLTNATLTSGSLTLTATAKYNPVAESVIKADLQLANLRLKDDAGKLPGEALGLQLKADTSLFNLGSKDVGVQVRQMEAAIQYANQPAGKLQLAANYDAKKQATQFDLKLIDLNESALRPALAGALGDSKLDSVRINATIAGQYNPKADSQVKANVSIANLRVTDPKGAFPKEPLALKLETDASFAMPATNDVRVQVRKLAGTLASGTHAAGAFDVSGSYNSKQNTADFTVKLDGLNQHALRPALASALGDNKLETVSLNISASGRYDAAKQSEVKADINLANLLITDPKGKLPKTPLAARITLDGSMAKQVLDLRQLRLALTPTSRARNELNIQGRVDLSKTNATSGQVKVSADSLDVTPYYDLFAGQPPAPQTAKATPSQSSPPAAPPAPDANTEPPAVTLPFRQFTVDLNLGRLFLREIALSNLVMSTKLDATTVAVNPFKLTFNGAPVTAQVNANLGVPGYQYDVQANAYRLPIAPIVDTFMTNLTGKAKGDLLFDMRVKGAGITGENLRRTLSGNLGLTLTNATIILPDRHEVVKGPVGTTLTLILAVIGPLAPVLQVSADDLLKPPISFLDTKVNLGGGQIGLDRFIVASDAFRANAAGTITIATVLSNSPINDIPVDIALSTSLAQKAHLARAGAATSGYTQLPNFVKLGGTLGKSKTHIDNLVIGGLVIKSVSGVGGVVGGKAGSILKGVSGLLTGEAPENSGTNKTNGTQPAIKINPFDLFKKKK